VNVEIPVIVTGEGGEATAPRGEGAATDTPATKAGSDGAEAVAANDEQ
jgi:hypothetical protein